MSDLVGAVVQTQSAPPAAEVRQKSAPQPPQAVPTDTVELSRAAQAALQEASETPTQTDKEPSSGDVQAKAQLAARQDAASAEMAQADAARLHVVA
jgi:hypothetical protein